jgi:uncharacterized protein YceH (UPF0502 family)
MPAPPTGLSASEARVLGCLLEKQRTTPDQYPLTLNALRLACNQSTNRDPVLDYDDEVIRDALHRLGRRGLVRLASGAGSRAPKYRHLVADVLPMRPDEQAVMCVLMLRGAQTPGELKQRADRMHPFADLASVGETLDRLIDRGIARRLGRRPGQKEERFAELLTDDSAGEGEGERAGSAVNAPAIGIPTEAAAHADGGAADAQRARERESSPSISQATLAELRDRVERLEREVALLRGAGAPRSGGVSAYGAVDER